MMMDLADFSRQLGISRSDISDVAGGRSCAKSPLVLGFVRYAPQPSLYSHIRQLAARETNALGGACFFLLLLIHFSFCLQPIF
jgi:hypothetical protein